MIRRALCCLTCAIVLTATGCWNYRGMDQMSFVIGIALDIDEDSGEYKISYEIADMAGSSKESPVKGKIIEARGRTLFDAGRDVKRRLVDKLYYGSAQVLVISSQIAREQGIEGVLKWFLSDGECRETVCVIISQEDTAREILAVGSLGDSIVAYEIHDIVVEDQRITSSSVHVKLYNVYNTLNAQGLSLSLPVFNIATNDEAEICELNGSAVFKRDRLIGFLSPGESKSLLFIQDEVMGGILTLSLDNTERHDISLEISKSMTKTSFEHQDGKVKIMVETDTTVFLAEKQSELDVLESSQIVRVERLAAEMLEENIKAVIGKVQKEFGTDIFGFGHMIFKRDYKLWQELALDWEDIFPTLEVDVSCKVRVANTAFIK